MTAPTDTEPDAEHSEHQPPHDADTAPTIEIVPPPPGRMVLACRCGAMLDLAELHRQRSGGDPDSPRSGFRIDPIRCRACATFLVGSTES